jgi:hypothetical protein
MEIVSTIGTGGNYTTIAGWLTASGTGGNSLDTTGGTVTVDYTGTNVYVGKVLNDLSVARHATLPAIYITGAPTTSTSYRILRGTAGNRPLLTGTSWTYNGVTEAQRFLSINEQYSRIEDLDATLTGISGSGTIPMVVFRLEAANTTVARCVARDVAAGSVPLRGFFANGNQTQSIVRCVAVNLSISSNLRNNRGFDYGVLTVGVAGKIINCTALNIIGGPGSGTGFQVSATGGTLQVHNCIAAGTTGTTANADYAAGLTNANVTHSRNMSEDATGDVGYTGITPSAVFADVTVGAEDVHLLGTAAAVNAGLDQSALLADAAIDIDGATVSGTWDIGADEATSPVGFFGLLDFVGYRIGKASAAGQNVERSQATQYEALQVTARTIPTQLEAVDAAQNSRVASFESVEPVLASNTEWFEATQKAASTRSTEWEAIQPTSGSQGAQLEALPGPVREALAPIEAVGGIEHPAAAQLEALAQVHASRIAPFEAGGAPVTDVAQSYSCEIEALGTAQGSRTGLIEAGSASASACVIGLEALQSSLAEHAALVESVSPNAAAPESYLEALSGAGSSRNAPVEALGSTSVGAEGRYEGLETASQPASSQLEAVSSVSSSVSVQYEARQMAGIVASAVSITYEAIGTPSRLVSPQLETIGNTATSASSGYELVSAVTRLGELLYESEGGVARNGVISFEAIGQPAASRSPVLEAIGPASTTITALTESLLPATRMQSALVEAIGSVSAPLPVLFEFRSLFIPVYDTLEANAITIRPVLSADFSTRVALDNTAVSVRPALDGVPSIRNSE